MKVYRIRFSGGAIGMILITLLSISVIGIPVALVTLLTDLEIRESNE